MSFFKEMYKILNLFGKCECINCKKVFLKSEAMQGRCPICSKFLLYPFDGNELDSGYATLDFDLYDKTKNSCYLYVQCWMLKIGDYIYSQDRSEFDKIIGFHKDAYNPLNFLITTDSYDHLSYQFDKLVKILPERRFMF